MPRPRKLVPSLQFHRPTGQARVKFSDGSVRYLGKWNSKQSRLAYAQLVAELTANGQASVLAARNVRATGTSPTVAEVLLAWKEHAERRYQKNGRSTGTLESFRKSMKTLRELYADLPANEFGPLKLEAVRAKLAEPETDDETKKTIRRSRSTVNRYARQLVSVFRWAASREMIPASVPQSLSMLQPIRRGEKPLPETKPVGPVDDATVAATVKHLSKVVADMVRLARATGMRPGEVCLIRPADVDRSGAVWTYRPSEHKLEHHGRDRIILIGPRGQDVLRPYLLRPADAFCFSPADSARQHREANRASRTTPPSYGNSPGTNVVRKPAREPGERFEVDSFRRAIKRAAKKAKVAPWHPNQLRHAFATEARRAAGLEAVQGLLGHSNLATSQIYAERQDTLARDVAARIG